jgi:hypothetical protein
MAIKVYWMIKWSKDGQDVFGYTTSHSIARRAIALHEASKDWDCILGQYDEESEEQEEKEQKEGD